MTRTRQLRCPTMWVAWVVLVMSVVAWLASPFQPQLTFRRTMVWVENGRFRLLGGPHKLDSHVDVTGFEGPQWRSPGNEYFGFYYDGGGVLWAAFLPLWIPVALAIITIATVWSIGQHTRACPRLGFCPKCGYALTGITALCPECGKEWEA